MLHRSLTGKEKKRIFENIDFQTRFPDLFKNQPESQLKLFEYESVWKEFYKILNFVKENKNKSKSEEIKTMANNWLKLFLKHHFQKAVTPYIHVFCNHLHEFVSLYGDINIFNLEGLEKLNDFSTIEFFRSSNRWVKRNSNFLKQIIEKRSQIELLEEDLQIKMKQTKFLIKIIKIK